MSDNPDVIRCLEIVHHYRQLAVSAKAAERFLIAFVAAGNELPVVHDATSGETLIFEAVNRVSKKRAWRNEAKARDVLLAMGFSLEAIDKPPRLKSPRQIEKFVLAEAIADLTVFPHRGVTVMPVGSGLECAEFAPPTQRRPR